MARSKTNARVGKKRSSPINSRKKKSRASRSLKSESRAKEQRDSQKKKSKGKSKDRHDNHDDGSKHNACSHNKLAKQARDVLSRSNWDDNKKERLSKKCCELLEKIKKKCPDIQIDQPLDPGEVLGDISLAVKEFKSIVLLSAGAKDNPKVVWSDGSNELLVNISRITIKTKTSLVIVKIPVSCEESKNSTVLVTFATGSPDNPAGLIFATDTVPDGPPEIVSYWGDSLIALAWSSLLRAITALAEEAGKDNDGAGLIPAGLSVNRSRVQLLVMARHEMDRANK